MEWLIFRKYLFQLFKLTAIHFVSLQHFVTVSLFLPLLPAAATAADFEEMTEGHETKHIGILSMNRKNSYVHLCEVFLI